MSEQMTGPLGIPYSRNASGTAWQPDATPMYALHAMIGRLRLMGHGNISLGYNRQFEDRGDDQFTSTNWVMFMASHPLLGGDLSVRTMLSLEPATLGKDGYPLLLQTGESFEGEPLHDRQHPHDLFMEIAAIYQHELPAGLAIELYGGPAGEPALGPPAFPHRLSAMSDPLGPIGHHWLDSTHISFGVITAGLFTKWAKLEGSWFNGREPDEDRWDFDFRGLDSYSGRLTVNPIPMLSIQGSYGFLESPEELEPDESLHRVTTSAMWVSPFREDGSWATTAAWGRNVSPDHRDTDAVLLESNFDVDGHHAIFGRAEYARKNAHDLVVADQSPDTLYHLGSIALGYAYSFGDLISLVPTIGVRGSIGIVPDALELDYGSQVPVGMMVFVRVSPAKMEMTHHGAEHAETDAKKPEETARADHAGH